MTAEKPLRPAACKNYLQGQLADSFRSIVRGFVKQAERGSVPHLKLITELLEQHAGQRREKGSAQLLLEKLERMERNGETAGADEPLQEPWPE